jgi:peptidoglycan/LPS O-acetylase OafA/YrhL
MSCWIFLGCLTAITVKYAAFKIQGIFSIAILIAIAVFLQIKSSMTVDLLIYPLSVLLIASLILSRGGVVKRILNLPGLTRLGTVSYSLLLTAV